MSETILSERTNKCLKVTGSPARSLSVVSRTDINFWSLLGLPDVETVSSSNPLSLSDAESVSSSDPPPLSDVEFPLVFQTWNWFVHLLGMGDLMTSCHACHYHGRKYHKGSPHFHQQGCDDSWAIGGRRNHHHGHRHHHHHF
jgi:hypothetical protein